jgi:hypothetical protein
MDEAQTLSLAREAIRQGNKETGRELLVELLRANPRNETAWLWLSAVVGDPAKERECLERVLKINPSNDVARRHLDRLNQSGTPTPEPQQAPAPPTPQPAPPPPEPHPKPSPPKYKAVPPIAEPQPGKKKTSSLRSIVIAVVALIILVSCCLAVWGSTPDSGRIVVEPGKLRDMIQAHGGYPSDTEVAVRKLNGSIDPRENDLEELAKDWLFYGREILRAAAQGNEKKAERYRAEFQLVNNWLDQYHQDDVYTMISLFEDQYR